MIDEKSLQGVLVVDDEPLVLKFTTSVITGLGCQKVFKARNAQEARAVLKTEYLSFVICDVSLPDGDGRQILREALEQNPETAGILITGFAMDDLNIPDDLRGQILLLEKPFTAEQIEQVLAEHTGRRALASHR